VSPSYFLLRKKLIFHKASELGINRARRETGRWFRFGLYGGRILLFLEIGPACPAFNGRWPHMVLSSTILLRDHYLVEIWAANLLGRYWVNVLIIVPRFVFDELAARKCISRTLFVLAFNSIRGVSAGYSAVCSLPCSCWYNIHPVLALSWPRC
jgi:hypothetical protein